MHFKLQVSPLNSVDIVELRKLFYFLKIHSVYTLHISRRIEKCNISKKLFQHSERRKTNPRGRTEIEGRYRLVLLKENINKEIANNKYNGKYDITNKIKNRNNKRVVFI